MEKCTLRRCQGKYGCICPKKPAPGFYGSPNKREEKKASLPKKTTLQPKQAKSNSKSGIVKSKTKTVTAPSKASDSKPPVADNHDEKLPASDPEITTQHPVEEDTNGTGSVIVCYSHYKKPFPILKGKMTAETFDSEYCLTFAFPNCKLHLSTYSPSDFSYEDIGLTERPMVHEEPPGTYHGLTADSTYWVHIEEDATEREAYEKRQDAFATEQAKRRTEAEENEAKGIAAVSQEKAESCSCIEGNPCMDSYGCKDWNNRYAVAKKHGWKGF